MRFFLPNLACARLAAVLCLALIMGCSGGEDRTAKAEEFYQTGLQALEEGKSGEALIHFRNAVRQNPSHAGAHYELGMIYVRDRQPRMAVQELRIAVDIDPELLEAKSTLATLYYVGGDFSAAVPLCEELIEQGEKTPVVFMILGNSLVRTGRFAEAIETLTTAEELFPENPDVKVSLAGAFFESGQTGKARDLMEAAASLSPENLSLQLLLAGFYQRIYMDGLAEEVLLRLMDEFPDQIAVHLSMARFLYGRGRFQDAQKVLERAGEQELFHPDSFQIQGILAHRRGSSDQALALFQEAVERYPEDQRSLMLLADYYVFLKDFDKARETYERVVDRWPDLSPVKARIGELLLAERRLGEADKQVGELVMKHPEYAPGHMLKGLLDMERGELGKARKGFSRAIGLDPRSTESLFYYGLTFLEEQDYTVSLSVMLRALEEDPDSVRVRFAMAYIYYRTGQLSSALDELDRILRSRPDDLRAMELRATVLMNMREWERAAKDYQAILARRPEDLSVRFNLARADLASGNLDRALEGFEQTMEEHEDPALPLEGIVQVHVRRQAFDQALALCDDHLEKMPGDLRVSLIKAGVLAAKGDPEAAVELLSRVRSEHPESDRPLLFLGRMALSRGETGEARELYRKAVDLNPEGIEAWMGLARIYIGERKFEEAVEIYERMLEKTGGHGPAENDLAYLYATLNRNLDRALELARSAREKLPGNPDVADTLGWVHVQRGSTLLGRQYLSEAIAGNPQNPLYHFHLGVALAREQRWKEAAESLDRALSLNLDQPERDRALELKQEVLEKQRLIDEAAEIQRS